MTERMGRLDLRDKPTDFLSVTRAYLNELYDEIDELKAKLAACQAAHVPPLEH